MAFAAYIICATPRSGTTLLCDLLAQTGLAGRPDSLYRRESIGNWVRLFAIDPGEGPEFERRYLAAAIRAGTGDTGMFGMRLMWPSLPELVDKLTLLHPAPRTDADRISAAFGTPLYIHVRRLDRVAQAVSRAKAEQSGLWHRAADGSERELVKPYQAPVYDAGMLARYIAEVEEHEAAWRGWFAAQHITPLELTYEQLSADPVATIAGILSVLGRVLGRDPGVGSRLAPQTVRLADTTSREWADRYRREPG